MSQLQWSEAGEANLTERFSLISHVISENFRAPWQAQPLGDRHRPARQSWACADGVVISRAQMSPMRLVNDTMRVGPSPKYYAYIADRVSWLRPGSGEPLRLPADEFLILSSDLACEWRMTHDYTTSSFVIDSALFHEYLPNAPALVGRRLRFPFAIDAVLRAMMESAWEASCAGSFEQVGPTLVRAFLATLSTASLREGPVACPRTKTSLDIRRAQVRAYIEQHYMQPDLSLSSIARHLQLSRRYVQMALAADESTPTEYLRRCRLAASSRLLRDPAEACRTITEIAFACGFNSSAHFSTEFKRAYGVSPRRFRSQSESTPVLRHASFRASSE